MLTMVQPCIPGVVQRSFSACRVVEFALGIVVQDQQPQRRSGCGAREHEHFVIAVGVAGREDGTSADAAPDADGLLRAVVEEVQRGLDEQVAGPVLALEPETRALPTTRSGGTP